MEQTRFETICAAEVLDSTRLGIESIEPAPSPGVNVTGGILRDDCR